VAAHSGYPERGRSALLPLLDALAAIRAADWGHDATLGPGTVNLGVVRAGLRANIVPDQAEAELFVRVVDSAAAVRARIESLLAGRPLEWSEDTSNDPQFLHAVPGERTTVVAFNTDVPHLTHFGKMHLVGPGSILDAHAPGERIAKRELLDAVDLYRRAVVHLRAS
jgi:acetylornithine deacetylase